MTNRFYQTTLGGTNVEDVTEAGASGLASGGVVVEVGVHYDGTGMNKLQVLQQLEAIRDYIVRDTYPPA